MLLLTPHCSKLLIFFIIFLLSFSLSLSCDSSPLSFTFSPPLRFPFSLHLEFVGLGCDRDAMLGVVGLQWFSWIMRLNDGSWWVSTVVRWVSFAIWHRWVLISVILIDFGGFFISVARFVGWSGWLWVLGVGWSRWLRDGCRLIDRGGWEMGWLWVWVDFGGCDLICDFGSLIFVVILWFFDLWFWVFVMLKFLQSLMRML